jgi:hypothetical protein
MTCSRNQRLISSTFLGHGFFPKETQTQPEVLPTHRQEGGFGVLGRVLSCARAGKSKVTSVRDWDGKAVDDDSPRKQSEKA